MQTEKLHLRSFLKHPNILQLLWCLPAARFRCASLALRSRDHHRAEQWAAELQISSGGKGKERRGVRRRSPFPSSRCGSGLCSPGNREDWWPQPQREEGRPLHAPSARVGRTTKADLPGDTVANASA